MNTETITSTNRLAQETSPYLLQHAHNPVDWYPWGDEALAKAKELDRPILLSIGYSACHWCHVMERESFSDPAVAKLMNDNFICVKLDREERPDVDDLYVSACINMIGHAGWPLNLVLTPDQKPFFAGTYFATEDLHGRPSWSSLLTQLAQLWSERQPDLLRQSDALMQKMKRQFTGSGRLLSLEPDLLDAAVTDLAQGFDAQWGGFGGAPKFPPVGQLQLVLRYYHRSKDDRLLSIVTRSLDMMAAGGIYDHISGGFCRYSVDERWLVPHFEKMLCDNALIARLYLEGYQATQQESYSKVAEGTLDYILRDLTSENGGFYSSTDAESETEEGKFYVWTPAEVEAVLDAEAASQFCAFYDITAQGNWQGKSVPNINRSIGQVAAQFGMKAEAFALGLQDSRAKLYEAKKARVQPALDDKLITSWNGLTIGAMAEGYRVTGHAKYLEAARKAANFMESHLWKDGQLFRTYRADQARVHAFLDDHANLANGLLDLYEACGDERYFNFAVKLKDAIQAKFIGEDGGFLDRASDLTPLCIDHRAILDGPMPPANATAAMLFTRLSYYLDQADLRVLALDALSIFGKEMRRGPVAFVRGLLVVDFASTGPVEIVYAAKNGERSRLLDALALHYVPNRILVWKTPETQLKLPLLEGKTIGDEPVVSLCQSSTCAEPVNHPKDLPASLEMLRTSARYMLYPKTPGKATPEATAKAGEALGNYRPLGKTGLMVSRLGFGSYRVEDESSLHEDSIREALDAGVNLIDTSSNYTDGSSERLIGGIIRTADQSRDSLVVVSKLGYVQGQSLLIAQARMQMGQPYPEMVDFQEGCWHCIHPAFLNDQLERSLSRLGLETMDICLLHNPEYFLMDAAQKGRSDLAAVRHEFYARVEQAFAFFEAAVQAGKITAYGVSSNTMIADPDSPAATNLGEFLRVAQKIGGDNHHFQVVQFPLNLLESQAYPHMLREAEAAGLGVLTNRPLNAFVRENLVRLADFELDGGETLFVKNVAELATLENEFRATFGANIQGEGTEMLFRFAENLRVLDGNLQNVEHWNQLESTRIRPTLQDQISALDQAIQGPPVVAWAEWRERFLAQFRHCMNDLEQMALEKSQDMSDSVRELFEEFVPEDHKQSTTSQLAAWVTCSTPGVTSVLVGMRAIEYVDDICETLKWPVFKDVDKVYTAAAKWFDEPEVVNDDEPAQA
jgi:uncharacterized protein